jgi:hypothetical protein
MGLINRSKYNPGQLDNWWWKPYDLSKPVKKAKRKKFIRFNDCRIFKLDSRIWINE